MRWRERICVLEGPDLVRAALDRGVEFEAIYVDRASLEHPDAISIVERASRHGVRCFALEAAVMAKVADAQTPQPVMATVRFESPPVSDIALGALTFVLHDLRDPGNVGTIIRSAHAAGASAVVLTGQSVDPFNPKTLRSTAGSVFHTVVSVADFDETLTHFESMGATTWATVVKGGTALLQCDLSGPSVVVIGNEAHGLDSAAIERCSARLSIAMEDSIESLNAGVAASLIAFVARWQARGEIASPIRSSLGAV